MGKNSLDARKAIICFQYTERIKSELMRASRAQLGTFKSDSPLEKRAAAPVEG